MEIQKRILSRVFLQDGKSIDNTAFASNGIYLISFGTIPYDGTMSLENQIQKMPTTARISGVSYDFALKTAQQYAEELTKENQKEFVFIDMTHCGDRKLAESLKKEYQIEITRGYNRTTLDNEIWAKQRGINPHNL